MLICFIVTIYTYWFPTRFWIYFYLGDNRNVLPLTVQLPFRVARVQSALRVVVESVRGHMKGIGESATYPFCVLLFLQWCYFYKLIKREKLRFGGNGMITRSSDLYFMNLGQRLKNQKYVAGSRNGTYVVGVSLDITCISMYFRIPWHWILWIVSFCQLALYYHLIALHNLKCILAFKGCLTHWCDCLCVQFL